MTPGEGSGGPRDLSRSGAPRGPGRKPDSHRDDPRSKTAGRFGDRDEPETSESALAVDESGNGEVAAEVVEEDLQQVLTVALQERDEYLDMLRRVQADFENYKKRMIRQQTELLERAGQQLVDKLLPALDAFDLARTHLADSEEVSEEGKALLQASALLFDSLAKEGLERVDDLGKPFDPTTQEAVEHDTTPVESEPTGAEEGRIDAGSSVRDSGPVVVGVLRPGYKWKGRVIRPAMVKVRG